MPVFECSRCSALTYSSSRANTVACERCGSERRRVLSETASFEDARARPRPCAPGDHCCVTFEDPAFIAQLAVDVLRSSLGAGGFTLAAVPDDLRAAIAEHLDEDEIGRVIWYDPADLYADGFDPDAVVERFRATAHEHGPPFTFVACMSRSMEDFTTVETFRRFERLVHETAVEDGMVVLCLYDQRLHAPQALAVAWETHPLVSAGPTVRRNEAFEYAPPD